MISSNKNNLRTYKKQTNNVENIKEQFEGHIPQIVDDEWDSHQRNDGGWIKYANANRQYLLNNIWKKVNKSPNTIFINVDKSIQNQPPPYKMYKPYGADDLGLAGPPWNQNITFDSGLKISSQRSNEKIPELIYIPEYKNKYYNLHLSNIIIIVVFLLLFFIMGLIIFKKFEFGIIMIGMSITILIVICFVYFTNLNYYYV